MVVGASAGGVEALSELFSRLPADVPASFFVVLHVPDRGVSVLPDILGRRGPLRAAHPADGAVIEPGRVYVAPPGHHLLVTRGRAELIRRVLLEGGTAGDAEQGTGRSAYG